MTDRRVAEESWGCARQTRKELPNRLKSKALLIFRLQSKILPLFCNDLSTRFWFATCRGKHGSRIVDSGFYAACAGLRAKSEALEIIANNLANLNSTGYRSHQANFRSLLTGEHGGSPGSLSRAVNDFGVLGGTRLDLSAGNSEQTGNPFDLAIEGDAVFAVQSAKQILPRTRKP